MPRSAPCWFGLFFSIMLKASRFHSSVANGFLLVKSASV